MECAGMFECAGVLECAGLLEYAGVLECAGGCWGVWVCWSAGVCWSIWVCWCAVVLVCGYFHWAWLRVDCWFTLNRSCVIIFGEMKCLLFWRGFAFFYRIVIHFGEVVWLIFVGNYLMHEYCLEILKLSSFWRGFVIFFQKIVWYFLEGLYNIFKGMWLILEMCGYFCRSCGIIVLKRLCDYFISIIWLLFGEVVLLFIGKVVWLLFEEVVLLPLERLCHYVGNVVCFFEKCIFWRGCVIYFLERLCDFLERLCYFFREFVWIVLGRLGDGQTFVVFVVVVMVVFVMVMVMVVVMMFKWVMDNWAKSVTHTYIWIVNKHMRFHCHMNLEIDGWTHEQTEKNRWKWGDTDRQLNGQMDY